MVYRGGMFFLVALLSGAAAGFWPKGWIAVFAVAAFMAYATTMEVLDEEGMSGWVPVIATAVTLAVSAVGYIGVRAFQRGSRNVVI